MLHSKLSRNFFISITFFELSFFFSSFLKNIQRIAELEYSPNNGILLLLLLLLFDFSLIFVVNLSNLDDILNVRLQTLGVMEHSFPVNLAGKTYHWKLYDVGGAVSFFV